MSKFYKVLLTICSVLMIALGIVCFFLPSDSYVAISYAIGGVTLAVGIIELIAYFKYSVGLLGGSWRLCEAIFTILFGVFFLANQAIVAGVLPFVAGIWLSLIGLTRFLFSFDLLKVNANNWWVAMISGLLDICLGVLFCFEPIGGAMAITIVFGVLLVIGGASMLSDIIYMHRLKKYASNYSPIDNDQPRR